MVPVLGLTHYVYAITIISVILLMLKKKDVVIVCLVGTMIIATLHTKSLTAGTQILFNAILNAGVDLFDIMLVISIMVGMLKSLNAAGAGEKMFSPLRKLIKNPTQAYFVLGLSAYVSASFFWPTPATALVGPLLIPVCVEAGLPAIAAAMAFNIFGHGMGLSGDLVIQGAIKISSTSAGVSIDSMYMPSALLSVTCGLVAGIVGYVMIIRDMKRGRITAVPETQVKTEAKEHHRYAFFLAVLVPLAFFTDAGLMVYFSIRGGDATALIGGTATLVLAISTIMCDGKDCFDKSVGYLREGFMFGIKVFSPVIPIAAFFFLGGPQVKDILGDSAPLLLFDIGEKIYSYIPLGRVPVAFGDVLIGMIAGLDGSGFAGLPLTGSMAAAFGGAINANIAPLAAAGQMGSVWSGGGTLVPWCFGLAATAGVAGVSPTELARKNFIPVCCGLLASTALAILMM
ncbi:MAG: hypothetical protein LBI74_08925 [Synergistaceae bacterium]|jgi:TRAP-type C4-dicarboxylate transport system permease large subunit|nr:hypothetical protein [Synergistaceae bacterium]